VPQTLSSPVTLNGRYVLERELGRGSLGTVYLARDLRQQGLVAVKVLRPDVSANGHGQRFLLETRVVANLQHANILPITDSGTSRGENGKDVVYSVSPYADGGSLRDRLEREPQLPLDEALRIAGAIAAALEHAHRLGIVHRGLAPTNVLFRNGTPLVDFGLGLMFPTVAPDVGLLTRAMPYASPEQVEGRALDPRTDQYTLAVLLYEMLSGEPPFFGPNVAAIRDRVLSEPPPRLSTARVVPRIVERAIQRALAKSQADRFPTVADFVAALQGASVTPPVTAATSSPPKRRRLRTPLIAAVIVLGTGAGVALAGRAVVNRRPAATSAHTQLTFTGTATSPALSPDGRSVLYVAGGRSLVLQRLDGGDPIEVLRPSASITSARWTGDGRAIVVAMTRDSTERPAMFLVPPSGGPPRQVLDDVRPFDTGSDATAIVRAAREPGRMEIVSLASGEVTRTITVPQWLGAIAEIAWSPDGRWIAFTDAKNGALRLVAVDGSVPTRLAPSARKIRWSASSDALYFLTGPAGTVDLLRVAVDRQSGRPVGNAVRVTALLAADAFDVGRGNRLVHTQTSRGPSLRMFVLGGANGSRRVIEEQPLSEGGAHLDGASISPDGRWVAYSATRGTDRDVHVVAFGGGLARAIAASAAVEDAPAWSPDGSRLTLGRQDTAARRVLIADVRSGSVERVGSLPAFPGAGARWSASGRHVTYYAHDERRIVHANLQRGSESIIGLPEHVGTGATLVVPSPNGTQLIASTRVGADDAALWLVFGNGRRWRKIEGPFGKAFPIAWHRNGWIYLVRDRGVATEHGAAHLELWRMRGPTGRPEFFASLPEGCGLLVSLSADALRGVCNYVRVESDLYVASGVGASGR
jgi:serine/threonine-protein kinase